MRLGGGGAIKSVLGLPPPSVWQSVLIGGGGFVTGMDIHPDGTLVCRVDVFGAYIGSTILGTVWRQLITSLSMPVAYMASVPSTELPYLGGGVYEVRIAPSNSSTLCLVYNGSAGNNNLTLNQCLVSQDRGVTWAQTNLGGFWVGANDGTGFRSTCGQRLAFDPANANIVYLGLPNCGMFVTKNILSGAPTWTLVPVTVPTLTSSSSSVTIGLGAKSFTVASGLTVPTGLNTNVVVYDTSNPANFMILTNLSYSGTTLSGTVTCVGGSGTLATWTIGLGTDPGIAGIVFDPTSGTTGGATNRLIVTVESVGVYISIDAGAGFSLIASSPTQCGHGKCAVDGTFYLTQHDFTHVWRISTAGVLTDITPDAQGYNSIICDPVNPSRLVADRGGGYFNVTTNSEAAPPTWSGTNFFHNLNSGAGQPGWVQASNDTYLTDGEMWFDPLMGTSNSTNTIGTGSFTFQNCGLGLNIGIGDLLRLQQSGNPANFILGIVSSYGSANGGTITISESAYGGSGTISSWIFSKERIWFSYGCGVLYTDGVLTSGVQQWWTQFAGIENLVANQVAWLPGGSPLAVFWDRPFWNLSNPQSYQSGYGPAYVVGQPVIFGASVSYAIQDQTFAVGLAADPASAPFYSGYSTNSGIFGTWVPFTALPPDSGVGSGGGTIVAIDSNRFVVARQNNLGIFQTQNGGVSWSAVTGAPSSGWGGIAFNASQKILTVDKVNSAIYAYNAGTSAGIWKSTDGGQSMSQVFTGHIDSNDFGLLQLDTVHGNAGHLFYTSADPAAGSPFWFSKDGGVTWSAVPSVMGVITFGTGAPKPGSAYPAVYIVGYVSGIYGVWRSDDFNATSASGSWNKMADFPPRINTNPNSGGWIDQPRCMAGNPNSWPGCVIGFQGSSFVFFGPLLGGY